VVSLRARMVTSFAPMIQRHVGLWKIAVDSQGQQLVVRTSASAKTPSCGWPTPGDRMDATFTSTPRWSGVVQLAHFVLALRHASVTWHVTTCWLCKELPRFFRGDACATGLASISLRPPFALVEGAESTLRKNGHAWGHVTERSEAEAPSRAPAQQ